MGTWIICGAIYIGSLFCQYKARNKMFWILATFTNEWHPFWKNILNICFSFYTCILWVTFVPFEVLQNWAVTEIVPYLIWAPDFFGPQEIWALHEKHYIAFSCRDQISWSPNYFGPNFLRAQISWRPKKSGAQMGSGTISVIAFFCPIVSIFFFLPCTKNM